MPSASSLSRRLFVCLLLAGVIARIAVLRLPGTGDLRVFSVWMHFTTTHSPTEVYGVGGWPPARRMMTFDGVEATVDYPPAGIYLLAAAGRVWSAMAGTFADIQSASVAVKSLAVAASATLTLLIWFMVRRRGGPARLASAAYWANPAVVLHGPVLGYIGSLALLPAMAAIFSAENGRAWLAGGLFALALLTKPQGIFVLPAVLLALVETKAGARASLLSAVAGAASVTGLLLAPFLFAGSLPNLAMSVAGLVTDGSLSSQAANVWWIAGYAMRVARHMGTEGLSALLVHNPIVGIAHLDQLPGSIRGRSMAFLALLAMNWLGVIAVAAWSTWRAAARNDAPRRLAVAAFVTHAYFVLALQVHENHLSFALPLLTIVAAQERSYRWLLAAISAVAALNLYLFYGFGQGISFGLPRSATIIDASVLLALANVAIFIWHLRLFAALCGPRPYGMRWLSRIEK